MIPRQMRPPRPRFPKKMQEPPNPNAPPKPVPVTTIFVGNITDKCHDTVVQDILRKCGAVCNWKRLQDSNGKFKAFGFCDFMHPDGARKALRILKDYPLGDKRLNVKADEDTEKFLEEFATNRAKLLGVGDDKLAEIDDGETDDAIKEGIQNIIEEKAPELLDLAPGKEADATRTEESEQAKDGSKGPASEDIVSKASSKRKRSRSSSSKRHRKHSSSKNKRSRSKRSRRHSSSSSSSSTDSSSAYTDKSSRKTKEKSRKHKKASRKRSSSSESSDAVAEKRRLKKELKEREESYLARLKKWEEREKRMARQYGKDEDAETQRQKTISREAKKLRQFLEDYQDERDDPKYYKGSALFERRRNYEREREADAKDRHEERKELEELKKMILKEKKSGEDDGKKVTNGTEKINEEGSEAPKEPAWNSVDDGQKSDISTPAAITTPAAIIPPPNALEFAESVVESSGSPAPMKIVTTLQQKTITTTLNGVFEEDEEEEDTLHQIKKKIKPFEITREDRINSLTPEERKKLIKELIARIPTDREKLFSFTISWEYLDEPLMEQRVQPWINKKICEYIGEEEPSLVSFICEKITGKATPEKILQDLSIVLDEEADVFMVKLWRLIVYESEAKRLGLNVLPSCSTNTNTNK